MKCGRECVSVYYKKVSGNIIFVSWHTVDVHVVGHYRKLNFSIAILLNSVAKNFEASYGCAVLGLKYRNQPHYTVRCIPE